MNYFWFQDPQPKLFLSGDFLIMVAVDETFVGAGIIILKHCTVLFRLFDTDFL
jgi:hypothetical protein